MATFIYGPLCQKYVVIYIDTASLVLLMKGVLCPCYCLHPSSTAELFKLKSGEGKGRGTEKENGK